MNHFTDGEWLDYVKGASAVGTRTKIERHLAEGCERCNSLHRLWREFVEVSTRGFRNGVPEDVLAASQAVYSTWRRRLLPTRARIAHLIFDSLMEPLPAGVRASGVSGRRLVHRLGRWQIDLRLEPEAGNRTVLTGQVLRSGKTASGQKEMRVCLMRAAEPLQETTANPFGEFQLKFERAKDLQIYIDIPAQSPIAVNLPYSDQ